MPSTSSSSACKAQVGEDVESRLAQWAFEALRLREMDHLHPDRGARGQEGLAGAHVDGPTIVRLGVRKVRP